MTRLTIVAGLTASLLLVSGGLTPAPAWAEPGGVPQTSRADCDQSVADLLTPDGRTRVLRVRAFRKGEALPNPTLQALYDPSPEVALADLCLVKLLVGPGNPGPAGAPSTSAGIGIEVWLPRRDAWNGRLHALAGGGWAGTNETALDGISSGTLASDGTSAPAMAGREGAVTVTTDTGHTGGAALGGSFAMNPDGSVNTALWKDFAERGIHEAVVKARALATAYYGAAPRYTYWDGGSTGGRQALKQAQRYPRDFDGIIAGVPAIHWTRFTIAMLYPQIVIQRDLGGKALSADQLNLVSNRAIAACDRVDGKHLGFILRAESCRYDPTRDGDVLCTADGGRNRTPACVTPVEALAINKIWYGMTADGSVPDPAVDNGFGPLDATHKWYGLPRGTNLIPIATSATGFGTDMVALALRDARLASPSFRNATANGADGWKSLSFARLAEAFDAAVAMQPQFGFVNTDDPDLSAFRARGGKLLHYHATNDFLIPHYGSVQYYQRVAARMGGMSDVRKFYRFYEIPGMGHGPWNGTSNPDANPPVPQALKGEFYALLTDWVEKGIAPDSIILTSTKVPPVGKNISRMFASSPTAPAKSLPLCAYPARITHVAGDIFAATSYTCR